MVIQNTPTKIDKIASLRIGQRGENLATDIKMDVSDWITVHPDASYYCLFKRPDEVQVQPVLSSLEEDVLTWTVRAWECAVIGVGYLEVRAVNPDTGLVAKSRVIPCAIEDSVIDDEGPVPPEMSWVGEVLAAKDTAVAAKTAAEEARDTAQTTVNGAIAGIQAEGQTQVGVVQAEGTTQVGAVQSEGTTQVGAVQAKGTEVLNSIPSDYTELSDDVTGLKSALSMMEDEVGSQDEEIENLDDRVEVLEPTATSFDIGKYLKAKTVSDGKVTEYEFGKTNGLTDDIKEALLDCFKNVAWLSGTGKDYYDALEAALYPPKTLVSITCVYTPGWDIYTSDSLDLLKNEIVVTAHYDDGTTGSIDNYTLSGTLVAGTSTVTVTYKNETTTFNVTVKQATTIDYTLDALSGLEWMDNKTYNQSTGELQTTSGEHCTEKFSVQDVIYSFVSSGTATSYVAIFVWDENDNYLGYQQASGGFNTKWQLDPRYTYAVKCYQPNTFNSSDITMMPVDNTEYQTPRFSIVLSDYTDDMQAVAGKIRVELDITSIFAEYGVEPTSYIDQNIKRMSLPGNSGGVGISFERIFECRIAIIYWHGKIMLLIEKQGATTTDDIIDYIENQNIILDLNY